MTLDEQTELARQAHKRGEPVEYKPRFISGDWRYTADPEFGDLAYYRPESPERTKARLAKENPDPYAEAKAAFKRDGVVDMRFWESEPWFESGCPDFTLPPEFYRPCARLNGVKAATVKESLTTPRASIPNPNPNVEVKEQLLSAVYDSRDRHRAEMETEAMDAQQQNLASILDDAKRIVCEDRNKTYGEPEDLFTEIAGHWSLHLGHPVTAKDVATMMLLLKATRCKRAPDDRDSWVDAAGYAACGGGI